MLVGVGQYQDDIHNDLPAAKTDLILVKTALTRGLKFGIDDIRILGEEGNVQARSFARALSEFEGMTDREDTFVLYFSGHGTKEGLCFSDGMVNLQSIIDYIERLEAEKKIVIIDCCYAGDMKVSGIGDLTFEEIVSTFAGRGIAVMASSAANEQSWLSESGGASLYTQITAWAILSRRNIRKGQISLSDINNEIRFLMQLWNKEHPDWQQHPVYRENYIGDIRFRVEEYHPYITQKITAETADYYLQSVKPMSTGSLKRFAAFVVLKGEDDTRLPRITWEIVSQFKNSDVYASAHSEERFRGKSADVIWCYFGHDEEDLARSNYFAYTTWAGSEQLREKFYRESRNTEIVDGIHIFWNTSYGMVKDLQRTKTPEEKIIEEYQNLAALLISRAEEYVKAMEEVWNGSFSYEEMKKMFREWSRDVNALYFKITDAVPAPVERIKWAESILELAGLVSDLTLYIGRNEHMEYAEERWVISHVIRRYHDALDKLKRIDNRSRQ